MKKTIDEIFDQLQASEIENLVNQNDISNISDDTLRSIKSKVYTKIGYKKKKIPKVFCWQTYTAVASCIVLIFMMIFISKFINSNPESSPKPTLIPTISEHNPMQIGIKAPQYYGNKDSVDVSISGNVLAYPFDISVTAELIEVLPDTYTFFDDWQQSEFRLLKMKTVKLLAGKRMVEEFYYKIPVKFMADFTVYDKFILVSMFQLCYEYSVIYNKTQEKAEQINLIIFSADRFHTQNMSCLHFIPFDINGNFDDTLWKSSNEWIEAVKYASEANTLMQAEKDVQAYLGNTNNDIHLLQDELSTEEKLTLESIKSFENGLYIPETPTASIYDGWSSGLICVRYANGFATNEKIYIGEIHSFPTNNSSFDKNDLHLLPDLSSAMVFVSSEYAKGNIIPPHIVNYQDLTLKSYGIFGWYAKTNDGVIGIIRVTWKYSDDKLDDAYYIVTYDSNECIQIDRDALLTLLEGQSTSYIYTGEYNDNGKDVLMH